MTQGSPDMRLGFALAAGLTLAISVGVPSPAHQPSAPSSAALPRPLTRTTEPATEHVRDAYAKLPLVFVEGVVAQVSDEFLQQLQVLQDFCLVVIRLDPLFIQISAPVSGETIGEETA